jgi:hypothetical protein
MIRLTHEEILLMHEKLIERYGGTCGLRDENLLDSALNAPFQCFGGQELYPTTIEKAVRLCFGLVKNHPFFKIKIAGDSPAARWTRVLRPAPNQLTLILKYIITESHRKSRKNMAIFKAAPTFIFVFVQSLNL